MSKRFKFNNVNNERLCSWAGGWAGGLIAVVLMVMILVVVTDRAAAQQPGPVKTTVAIKEPEPMIGVQGHTNIYGAHLLVQEGKPGTRSYEHMQWARNLVGQWGFAKTLFTGITKKTQGPNEGWIDYVNSCYKLEMVPVVRLGGVYVHPTGWVAPEPDAPGDYSSMAAAIKRVVERLPRIDKCPLYVEVWNEPNLAVEWSNKPNPKEYADFFVQAAEAIRSIGDSRIRIINGGLATDFAWLEKLCEANPKFVTSFDVWASHPYPQNHPPAINYHDKTAPHGIEQTIDSYMPELEILRKYGRDNVPVMLTETGYDLGNRLFSPAGYPIIDELNRADYMIRAFRDYWPKWPEIIAVFPFEFSNDGWQRFDWVYPDSGTDDAGRPKRIHAQYGAVAALAKVTDTTGGISGTITIDKLGATLEGATVMLDTLPIGAVTDPMGNYLLPKILPGTYKITVKKKGFDTIEQKVTAKAGENTVVNIALVCRDKVKLTGTVRSGDTGKPLSGVTIELQPSKQTVRTSSEGRYEFRNCIPARYTLTATLDSFETYSANVQVSSSDQSNQNMHDFVLGRRRATITKNELENGGMEAGGGGGGKEGLALGFESLLAGYRDEMTAVSDKFAHTGRLSQEMRMYPEELILRQITHYHTAQPGKTWVAGAWVRTDSSDDKAAAWLSLAATGGDGNFVAQTASKKVTGRSDGWVWLEVQLLSPPNANRISVNLHTQGSTGSAYFDDVSLGIVGQ